MSTFGFMPKQVNAKGSRSPVFRRWPLVTRLLIFAVFLLGVSVSALAQPRLLVQHTQRLNRIAIPQGARFEVRLQGDPFFRHVSLAVLRSDTVGLYLERAASPETIYLPVSAIHEVRYRVSTESRRVGRVVRSGLIIGGASFLAVRAINSSQLSGGFASGAGFWVAAGALTAGVAWGLLQRQRYYVGPGGRWALQVLDM